MDTNLEHNKQYLQTELQALGLEVTPEAWRPLDRINFKKLVQVHDHEEAFLRSVFVSSLKSANQMRVASGRGTKKLNAHDVGIAMLMLGAAVAYASDSAISKKNKGIIKDICPLCGKV